MPPKPNILLAFSFTPIFTYIPNMIRPSSFAPKHPFFAPNTSLSSSLLTCSFPFPPYFFFAFDASFPHPSILYPRTPSSSFFSLPLLGPFFLFPALPTLLFVLHPSLLMLIPLADLEHFRCNRVYVPWMNKGRRRSNSRWNAIGKPSFHFPPFFSSLTPTILK